MRNLRHHSLVAWQRADDLFIRLHKLATNTFPSSERFELASQLRKAAYSVPANIAEGFGRRHVKERLQFLSISEASLTEVGYCLHAAWRLGYITKELLEELQSDVDGVGAAQPALPDRRQCAAAASLDGARPGRFISSTSGTRAMKAMPITWKILTKATMDA